MSTSTWTGAVNSDWDDADNWSPAGVPGADSDVTIATGAPAPVASASIGTVNSITDSFYLSFESAGTNTVATSLDNTGHLRVDANGGEGGTILNVGGALTDSGHLRIGNATLSASDEVTAASLDNMARGPKRGTIDLTGSSADQALLDVAGSAGFGTAGILSGHVRLAGDSAIEFASGEITSLAANAQLHLNGNDAFIEDSAAPGSNSALTGLASIGAGAILGLHNKASVSTSGSLANDGDIRLDIVAGSGGSSLTLAGALTNSGTLQIGNAALSASDEVKAASLDNTGSIDLTGSSANQALLDVTTGVAGFGTAGVGSGYLELAGDSAIEFASGEITSLGEYWEWTLNGSSAFIEDSTAPGSNSALTGLSNVAGDLSLNDGASVSTTGGLVIAASYDGGVFLDHNRGDGGSNLTVAGTLTNNRVLAIGNSALSTSDKVSATALTNTGSISLTGSSANQALLDVTAGIAGFGTVGVLSGYVGVGGDSAIEFTSGQITTIAAGASLSLSGNDAFIEDSTALDSNSALALADIAGGLNLSNGASLSTGALTIGSGATLSFSDASLSTGALTNSGSIGIDSYASGGSTLSIGGVLTNTGTLHIGGEGGYFSPSDSVTAKSFVNSGTVGLEGQGTSLAVLNVTGTITNNGSISITTDTEELAGAVGGAGSFSLSTANLQFDSSVSSGQSITESGTDALVLEQAQKFAATISGFGSGDTIDATNFLKTGTTYNFVENMAGTGGTLTLRDASLTANILMTGVYTKSDFTLAPDSGTGTLVKFV
jgi:fibronectin-binding autotransporter adhesin